MKTAELKVCVACGMPMKEPSEFAMGDTGLDYCVFCARPDGSMQSFDEKREGLTDFIVKTQGFDRTVAFSRGRGDDAEFASVEALF